MNGTRPVAPSLIGEIRRRSGLRPAELARRAGLPRSVVSAYEHGRRQPGVDALARLASAGGLQLRIGAPPPPVDPQRAARILAQVLDLAEALPSRRRGPLDRTKDWADIEEIAAAGALEIPRAVKWLEQILGSDSAAGARLKSLSD